MHHLSSVVVAGLLLASCTGGDGGTGNTTTDGTTGTTGTSTGDTTAIETGSTTAVPTSGTAEATTGSTTDATTEVTTGATDATSTTAPLTTTDPATDDGGQTTNGGPAPTIDCGELPPGVVGVEYSALLEAMGGMGTPYTWEVGIGDELPPGLQLVVSPDTDTAEIAGIATEAGSFMFTIVVTSEGVEDEGQGSCELVIAAAATDLAPR